MGQAVRTAVVILAGGEGRRIGGAKPLRLLAGRTLIEHALGLARQWSDAVAIAVQDETSLFPGEGRGPDGTAGEAGPRLLPGNDPGNTPLLIDGIGDGPIAGLASALAFASAGGFEAVLTIPTDTPLLPNDLADRLSAALDRAAIAASGGRLHPTCALWRMEAASALPAYLETGRRSLLGFAETIGFGTAEWPAEPFDPFFNVNSLDDLAEAEALLRSR